MSSKEIQSKMSDSPFEAEPSFLIKQECEEEAEEHEVHAYLEDALESIDELLEDEPEGSHPEYMQAMKAMSPYDDVELRIVRYMNESHPDDKEATIYMHRMTQVSTQAKAVAKLHIKRGEDGLLTGEQVLAFHGHAAAIEHARNEFNRLQEGSSEEVIALESYSVTLRDVVNLLQILESSESI